MDGRRDGMIGGITTNGNGTYKQRWMENGFEMIGVG
jgi:hypothetical protein